MPPTDWLTRPTGTGMWSCTARTRHVRVLRGMPPVMSCARDASSRGHSCTCNIRRGQAEGFEGKDRCGGKGGAAVSGEWIKLHACYDAHVKLSAPPTLGHDQEKSYCCPWLPCISYTVLLTADRPDRSRLGCRYSVPILTALCIDSAEGLPRRSSSFKPRVNKHHVE
jgi:hypothetical protein